VSLFFVSPIQRVIFLETNFAESHNSHQLGTELSTPGNIFFAETFPDNSSTGAHFNGPGFFVANTFPKSTNP
jgi:hypothetical protein